MCHSSNDRPAPAKIKAVVPKGHLAVLAAKVALLPGAPSVELQGDPPHGELNYTDTHAHFQKQNLEVAAFFLLDASGVEEEGRGLFESALGLSRPLDPPPETWA